MAPLHESVLPKSREPSVKKRLSPARMDSTGRLGTPVSPYSRSVFESKKSSVSEKWGSVKTYGASGLSRRYSSPVTLMLRAARLKYQLMNDANSACRRRLNVCVMSLKPSDAIPTTVESLKRAL